MESGSQVGNWIPGSPVRMAVEPACISDRSTMTGRCRSREVSDRSELTVARSCTVATSVPEERGHSVVDSLMTAANVGVYSSHSSSTSSALCRLDNFHYDLPNLSVTVEKLVVDCVQCLTCVDLT